MKSKINSKEAAGLKVIAESPLLRVGAVRSSAGKWIMVTFDCSDGWEKVTTSIPISEMENDKQYLEKQGFNDVKNIHYEIRK